MMPAITFQRDRLAVRFDQFGPDAYRRFLQVKALPESEIEFDRDTETYTVTAPARYAVMLGDEFVTSLCPGQVIGGDGDCGKCPECGVYIYALVDPRTNAIRYIGKSVRPRQRRSNHLQERPTCHRTRWLASLRREGLQPVMLILQRLRDGDDWQSVERDWIAYGRAQGWPLTNSTDGGDGVPNLPPESRERIRQASIGRNPSEETRRLIGIKSRGRKHSDDHKSRMSSLFKGRHFSDETRQRISEGVRKVGPDQAREIRSRLQAGETMAALSKEYAVERTTLRHIKNRTGCYAVDPE